MKMIIKTSIVIILIAIAGCASPGRESFDRGLALEKSNRLEDASSFLEDALAKNPQNKEYSDALARAQKGMVSQYLTSAKNFLDEKPFTYDRARSARSAVDKAVKLSPNDSSVIKTSSEVSERMDAFAKRAELLYAGAGKDIELYDWPSALDKLNQIKEFYPNYIDLPDKITRTETAATSWYLHEAEKSKEQDDLESAIKYLGKAAELQPKNRQISDLISSLSKQNTPAGYLSRAEAAMRIGDLKSCVALARKGLLLSKDPASKAPLDKIIDQATLISFELATVALKNKQIYLSYSYLITAKSFNISSLESQSYTEFVENLASTILEKTNTYETNGNFGNALIWLEKYLSLKPGNNEANTKIFALRDKIKLRVVKKIAVMDFTSPGNNPEAGPNVTANLLSFMTRSVSGDVKILARDVLGALLKEIELGQAGLYDIESAKKAGKLKGTDIFIFGNVLRYSIDKENEEGLKRVNAVVGKKTINNPAYESWVKQYPYADEKQLKMAPSRVIDEEIREIISYKVGTHKKIANVGISFRVIDVDNGEVVISKTLKRRKEVVDTFQDGVEFANISFKELKLPSDSELFENVVEDIIEELSQDVLSRFQNLQLAYFNNAKKLMSKNAYEMAIEKYEDAIIVEDIKNITTQVTENSRQEIEQSLKKSSL